MGDIVEQRLQNTIAELEADLAHHQQQLDETQKAMGDIQETIAELKKLLSDRSNTRHPSAAVAPQPTGYEDGIASSQESPSTTDGSLEGLTRRQLIRRIVPEFHGETFTASEVREKFLEQYLEVEPPNFPAALNNLLQRMAEAGDTIKKAGRKGNKPTDPWLYQQIQNQEVSFLDE